MKIVSDVLHLSYLDKFGLRVTVKAGQALAVLYSEARLQDLTSSQLYHSSFNPLPDGPLAPPPLTDGPRSDWT